MSQLSKQDKKTIKIMSLVCAARYLLEELETMLAFDIDYTKKLKQFTKNYIPFLERLANVPINNGINHHEEADNYNAHVRLAQQVFAANHQYKKLSHEQRQGFQAEYNELLQKYNLAAI